MKFGIVPISMDMMAAFALCDMIMKWPDMLVRAGFDPSLSLDLGVLHAAQWIEVIRRTAADPGFDPSRDIH